MDTVQITDKSLEEYKYFLKHLTLKHSIWNKLYINMTSQTMVKQVPKIAVEQLVNDFLSPKMLIH